MKKQQVFLIKPAGSLCNMRCKYCFYEDEAQNRQNPGKQIMSRETRDLLIDKAIERAAPGGSIQFSFQGGEPTMAGLAWFEEFVEAVKTKIQESGRQLETGWSIQTNGLNINEDWAAFFQREGFLVGVSLDGNKAIHDDLRKDAAGKGTFSRIEKAIRLLQKAGVDVNLLCVVTRFAARKPVQVYQALKKTGTRYLQFIPCLDPMDQSSSPWSLTPKDYENFLLGILRLWKEDMDHGTMISIRMLEDLAALMNGYPAGSCAAAGTCGAYLVAEADGSLYPCDFYCVDEWKLGDVSNSLSDPALIEKEQQFQNQSLQKPAACKSCRYQKICKGGCPRDWQRDEQGNVFNRYCQTYQNFFDQAVPVLYEVMTKNQIR